MSLLSFIKSRLLYLLFQALILIYIDIFMYIYAQGTNSILFISLFFVVMNLIYLAIDFIRIRPFYNSILHITNNLDDTLNLEGLTEPSFEQGKITYDYLKQLKKFLMKKLNSFKINQMEYQEYLEKWLHEIKIPISTLELICENNKNEVTKSIYEENRKIYMLVEQALYYSKSSYLESDIEIREHNLEDIINSSIRNNATSLISLKAIIRKENISKQVFTDSKWLEFILNQIINNSIKYRSNVLELTFSGINNTNFFVLEITDNGIGIPSDDLPRVFEKGFTGKNGRSGYKSTGIGLYLVNKMAKKLHLNIEIESIQDEYTKLSISFPLDSTYKNVTKM